jgi:nitrogen fixation protein FixH
MNRPLASPKPLTGGKVLFMLLAFFAVVITVNVIMARLAGPALRSIAPTAPAWLMRMRS